jgi:beta-lactamase superfamily II metal-dependent hydrolase
MTVEVIGLFDSVGEGNRHGHPCRDMLERAAVIGAAVHRTGEWGQLR